MKKVCIDCKEKEVVERKRCKECVLVFNRMRVKQYHRKDKPRYGIVECSICGERLIKGRLNQVAHGKCRRKVTENYNTIPRNKSGRATIGRDTILKLGFNLSTKQVIHHYDENPNHNVITNLWIMSRSKHNSLHRFLQQQWSLYMKVYSSNLENCWNNLRDQLTTAWLEMTGAIVIKITDIGQSAAEPLNENYIYIFSHEEGSETMHQIPETENAVGKDIVQTCNKDLSLV